MKLSKIKKIVYFTKGHRGLLYLGEYKKKKVVIKTKKPESQARGRIKNEANFLKILNKKNIGPAFISYNEKEDFLVYEYVAGDFFSLFLQHSTERNKELIKKIIKQIFLQCYKMDRLKINKEEMHHPYKHIIIKKYSRKPVLLDFERCHYVQEPVNVTQFCSYIISGFITEQLKKKGIKANREKIIEYAKKYKKDNSRKNLDKIINEIK